MDAVTAEGFGVAMDALRVFERFARQMAAHGVAPTTMWADVNAAIRRVDEAAARAGIAAVPAHDPVREPKEGPSGV